jgi:hypothetical protein
MAEIFCFKFGFHSYLNSCSSYDSAALATQGSKYQLDFHMPHLVALCYILLKSGIQMFIYIYIYTHIYIYTYIYIYMFYQLVWFVLPSAYLRYWGSFSFTHTMIQRGSLDGLS